MDNIKDIIQLRRTVKSTSMNGKKIDDAIVQELLQLADWAPTHGLTEPWYFVVFSGDKAQQFAKDHADIWKQNTPAERFTQATYDKFATQADLASHVIAICMKRGANANIPEIEEIEAVACAVQNILLAATAQNIATFWSTGGMSAKPAMQDYLGLRDEDKVLGLLYLGYTDEAPRPGRRIKPLEEKVKWM